eukprot:CAMPEP_0175914028 /NCGR_PEP_ID=MMETSP0108-20121206/9579_1 /TAXON_ID=195067 ORGANISM="Goniomonas pacifica, Strain CCMP1869" /NCGR_SAMPLE_ID=MMETSP0108 /ASSEMBLY_ACC=CAM_ASM_000204 /LENGTH=68 /DNA_ID=CAMNT_0017236455 /DNA_START=325 /DNA_END=531 /DNA_ORIENTATION=-
MRRVAKCSLIKAQPGISHLADAWALTLTENNESDTRHLAVQGEWAKLPRFPNAAGRGRSVGSLAAPWS